MRRMQTKLIVGNEYTRDEVGDALNVPESRRKGDWFTGYTRIRHEDQPDQWLIFSNIGVAGRTGHDYENHFNGKHFVWYGRTGSKASHPSIQSMISDETEVLVFTREEDRSPFKFHGLGKAVAVDKGNVPVRIVWGFGEVDDAQPQLIPHEVEDADRYYEGATTKVRVNRFERNPAARRACIAHYGPKCVVCGFDFEEIYGELGKGFIEVHHLTPLADVDGSYEVDPVRDLRPVCSNCHAIIHRWDPILSIGEVQALVQ